MEFLPGGDLYSLLQKFGSLDERSTKYYTLQILNALQYLHSNGIIHRDLKPDNVLVAADGRLKLSDFGLSYIGIVENSSSLIKANSIVGTPDYVAPEIILNQPHTFSADYWSLGVVLYECLVGAPPFHGESEQETFDNIISGRYRIEEDFELSKKAIDLISKLLTIDPNQRLGARDITDIINHPFFNGVSVDDDPPFKPDLVNEEDTEYFDTRYAFSEKEESEIIADITASSSSSSTPQTISATSSTISSTNCINTPSLSSVVNTSSDQAKKNDKSTLVTPSLNLDSELNESKMITDNFESISVKSLAEETRMAIKRKRSRSLAIYRTTSTASNSSTNTNSNNDSNQSNASNNNSNNIVSPSFSSECISSPSPHSSDSSASGLRATTEICPSNNEPQLSILTSTPSSSSQTTQRFIQFNKSLPPSFVIPPLESPPHNKTSARNKGNLKPLINTSHCDTTLVIPFHKQQQPVRNFSRRKRQGNLIGSCGSSQVITPLKTKDSNTARLNKSKNPPHSSTSLPSPNDQE